MSDRGHRAVTLARMLRGTILSESSAGPADGAILTATKLIMNIETPAELAFALYKRKGGFGIFPRFFIEIEAR